MAFGNSPKTQERTLAHPLLVLAPASRAAPAWAATYNKETQCLSSIMPLVPFTALAEVTLAICMVLFELSAVAITVTALP
jgi:hypothetical protein